MLKVLRESRQPKPDQAQHDTAKYASELLNSQEVLQMAQRLDANIHYINGTIPNGKTNENSFKTTFKEKLHLFLDKKKSENFLPAFLEKMDSKASDITRAEGLRLDASNNLLIDKQVEVDHIISILIEAQRQNLTKRGVDPKAIEVEINHIKDVVALTKNVFPKLPVLHLAAAVHDSYKHVAKNYNELGLHELASTAFGGVLVETVLKKFGSELGLDNSAIALIKKLVERAIFTHGTQEYPRINTAYDQKHPQIGALHGSDMHVRPKRNSYDETRNPSRTVAFTILGLNYLDALTGTDPNSLLKYNLASSHQKITASASLEDYFIMSLFNSFESNMTMKSGRELLKLENQALDEVIARNNKVKEMILLVLSRKKFKLRTKFRLSRKEIGDIDNKHSELLRSFRQLQDTNEHDSFYERSHFNNLLEEFVTYIANVVTSPQK